MMTETGAEIHVGQLWRRRRDGRRFIPAVRIDGGWLDREGIRRTEEVLHTQYVLVRLDDV